MSQLKPTIIVLLMLTSALAGCTGTDITDLDQQIADLQQSNDQMNETINQQNQDNADLQSQLEAELASKDATIAILLGNISGMEEELDAVDNVIEMYYMMFVQIQDDMNDLESDINCQIRPYAYCSGAFLFGADLTSADLRNADLRDADLSGANLTSANLNGADLSNANLNGADLTSANLTGADLTGVDLTGVDLTGADLTGADLSGLDLSGVDLTGANLDYVRGMNLLGCPAYLPTNWQCPENNLIGPYSNLNGAVLRGDLSNASLWGANLTSANLNGVDLTGANLSYASLVNAYLGDVDLTGADLTNAYLNNVFWYYTICPDGTVSEENFMNTCEYNL